MTRDDAHNCMSLLTELFPQADLQTKELEVFRDALVRHYEVTEAMEAIRHHRLSAKFPRPSFPTILADLHFVPQKLPATFADIIRAANPKLSHCSAAELVMRYHRREWFIYSKPIKDAAAQNQRELNEKEQLRLDERCAAIISSCERDLWALPGFDRARAERAAAFVVENQHDFNLAIDDLSSHGTEAMEVVDAIT